MAANTVPIFPASFKVTAVAITTAETSLTAPTNVGTVYTAGSNGSVVERVRIKARATTTAGIVRLWIHDGSNYFLLDEVLVTAITPSATVATFQSDWTPPNGALSLQSGYSLRATTDNGEDFNVIALGGDY